MIATSLLQKRIPTILGIVCLVAGLGVAMVVMGTGTSGFFPKASPETTPKQLKLTNITDTSFSVSFITDSAVPATVKYGAEANKLKVVVNDDRDQLTGTSTKYVTHHITIRNLTPSTKYYFVINTGSSYVYSDNGKPYEVSTGPRLGAAPEALTAYGTVMTKANQPAGDSLLYISLPNISPLSTVVKSSGSWAIPLSTARNNDLKAFARPESTASLDILVQGKDGSNAQVSTLMSNTQPVPTITLGQRGVLGDADLAGSGTPAASGSPAAQGSTATAGASLDSGSVSEAVQSRFTASQLGSAIESSLSAQGDLTVITIMTPAEEGSTVTNSRPTIEGQGPANTTLTVSVHSDPEYTGTVTTGPSGAWSYTPPEDLADGEHTITVTYKDALGRTQTESRVFLVEANSTGTSGSARSSSTSRSTTSNPAYSSSPSGKLSTPTPTPKAKATATPKASASATTRKARIASGSAMPSSGSVEMTYLGLGAGLMLIGLGVFLSRKNAFLAS